MSAAMRPARSDEVMRVWPAVKAARLMASAEAFSAFRDTGPWRVQVTEAGEALVVASWRDHLDVLAIRGLWAAAHRAPELVEAAASIARAQGFASVLSPLVALAEFEPYRQAGMRERERLVALQIDAGRLAEASQATPTMRIRVAHASDIPSLAQVDAECFDVFWRYGTVELADSMARERIILVEDEAGKAVGYATVARYGATATLGRLAVSPNARRRGLGAALCIDAGRWACDAGALSVTLCTQAANAASRSLYAALGFTELSECFTLGIRPLSDEP